MPFGKYIPSEEVFGECMGREVLVTTPAGYAGLFWGTVYEMDGTKINHAEAHFEQLALNDGKDRYEYVNLIADVIDNHCHNYIAPYCGENGEYNYQSGFGGDESDGMIDFWCEKPIPRMPNSLFGFGGKTWFIKWEYSNGYDQ